MTPLDRAISALEAAKRAADQGDCLAAEVAKDDCLQALEESARESAAVVVANPGTSLAADARAKTTRVGEIYAEVCLAHSRARVVALRGAR